MFIYLKTFYKVGEKEMKKGQAALEYLLTYGWAILIVIIVGASLYSLGVFTPGQWTGKRQTGFSQFRVEDFKLDTDEILTVVFKNQVGKSVTLHSIEATFKGEQCTFAIPDDLDSASSTISPTIVYMAEKDCTSTYGNLEERTSFSITVDFFYEDLDSGLNHTDSGTLFGSVER